MSTETSFPFDAVITDGVADRVYSAEDFAAERGDIFENGIIGADSLKVTADDSLAVYVAPGRAIINGYGYSLTASKKISVDECEDSTRSRRDTVVLRLNKEEREISLGIVNGEYAMHPDAPTLTENEEIWEIPLCDVLVSPDAEELTESDITDRRVPAKTKLAAGGAGKRVLLATFTADGSFSTADYPSKDNLYDVEMVGGGGSGGMGSTTYSCGGGGGAGASVTVTSMTLLADTVYAVTVGGGGASVKTGTGSDGGDSVFAGITAVGGKGGTETAGGEGGVIGCFSGESGTDGGKFSSASSATNAGAGANSRFGKGGAGCYSAKVSVGASGKNGFGYGSGGSGGGKGSSSSNYSSGAGCSGAVYVYGYTTTGQ